MGVPIFQAPAGASAAWLPGRSNEARMTEAIIYNFMMLAVPVCDVRKLKGSVQKMMKVRNDFIGVR